MAEIKDVLKKTWDSLEPKQKRKIGVVLIGTPILTYLIGKKVSSGQTVQGNDNKTVSIKQNFYCLGDSISNEAISAGKDMIKKSITPISRNSVDEVEKNANDGQLPA